MCSGAFPRAQHRERFGGAAQGLLAPGEAGDEPGWSFQQIHSFSCKATSPSQGNSGDLHPKKLIREVPHFVSFFPSEGLHIISFFFLLKPDFIEPGVRWEQRRGLGGIFSLSSRFWCGVSKGGRDGALLGQLWAAPGNIGAGSPQRAAATSQSALRG